jgi:AbrB family looped-hinge helix DNA binding protein
MTEYIRMGKRGTLVIPADIRRQFGLGEGAMLAMETSAEGIMLKPVQAYETEVYTPQRIAEFLLNNAVDAAEFDQAIERVRRMGLDPDSVPHQPRPE